MLLLFEMMQNREHYEKDLLEIYNEIFFPNV
jgi:hypothetical protein